MNNFSRKELMEVKVKESIVYIKKYCLISMEFSIKFVFKHPFVVSFAFFLFFLYSCFPSLFSFLVSSFPVLSCTALLLGILLSYGEPNMPELEEEKINREVSSRNAGMQADRCLLIQNENYSLNILDESKIEIEEKISKDFSSDAENERLSGFLAISPSVQELNKTGEKHIVEHGFVQNLEVLRRKDQSESELWSEISGGVREEIEGLTVKVSKPLHDDWLDSSLNISWQPILDATTDSESDQPESSSPDASMMDILPMLDELHPLLDSRTPYRALKSVDNSDLELSQQNESDEDSVEQEDECKTEEMNESCKAVTWTADDQENLMDLGSSDLERNRRLESLIERRRARKNQIIIFEKDLIDRHSNETAKNELFRFHPQIPPIYASRRNAFVHPYDTDLSDGLPPIPGSAPSVLLSRQNPFEFLCNDEDSSKDLGENVCQPVFGTSQGGYSFRRQESFSSHSALPGNFMHEKRSTSRLNPNFVAKKMDSIGSDNADFHKDLKGDNDSKSISISALSKVSSVDWKVPTEQEVQEGMPSLPDSTHENETVEKYGPFIGDVIGSQLETVEKYSPSIDNKIGSHLELGVDGAFVDQNTSPDIASCIVKEVFDAKEPGLPILDILNHEEVEVKQEDLIIFSSAEKVEENFNISLHGVIAEHKESHSVLKQSSESMQFSDASVSNLVCFSEDTYSNQADVPIYDFSPSISQNFLASVLNENLLSSDKDLHSVSSMESCIKEDLIVEASLNARVIEESKQSSDSFNQEIGTLSGYENLDESILMSKKISEAGDLDLNRSSSPRIHEDYDFFPSKVGSHQPMEKFEMQASFKTYKNDDMLSGIFDSMKFSNHSRRNFNTELALNDATGNSQNDITNDFQNNQSSRSLNTFYSEDGDANFEAGEMQNIDDHLLNELDAVGDFQVEDLKCKECCHMELQYTGKLDIYGENSDLRSSHSAEMCPNKIISISLNNPTEKALVFEQEGPTYSEYWFWGTAPIEDLTVYKPKINVLDAYALEELHSGELIEENPQDAVQLTLAGMDFEDGRDVDFSLCSSTDFTHNNECLSRNGKESDLSVVNTSGYGSAVGLINDSEISKAGILLDDGNLQSEEIASELLVIEAKSFEDIHSAFNQVAEEGISTSFFHFSDLEPMTARQELQVTEPSSVNGDNSSKLSDLEARPVEDINLALEYLSENFSAMPVAQNDDKSFKAHHDPEVMVSEHPGTPYNLELLKYSDLIDSNIEQPFDDCEKLTSSIDVEKTMIHTVRELDMEETWLANSKNGMEPSFYLTSLRPVIDSEIMNVKHLQTSIDLEPLALGAKYIENIDSSFKSLIEGGLHIEAKSMEEASLTLMQAAEAISERSLPSDLSKTASQGDLELEKLHPDHNVLEDRFLINGDNNSGVLVLESRFFESTLVAFDEDAESSVVQSFTALNDLSHISAQEANISDFSIIEAKSLEELNLAFRQAAEDCIFEPTSKVDSKIDALGESFVSSEDKASENMQSVFSNAHREHHEESSSSVVILKLKPEDNDCHEAENYSEMLVIEAKIIDDINSAFKQATNLTTYPLLGDVRPLGWHSVSSSLIFESESVELADSSLKHKDQDHSNKATFLTDPTLQIDELMEDNLVRKRDPELLLIDEKSIEIDSTQNGSNQIEAHTELECEDFVLSFNEAVLVSDAKQIHGETNSESHQDAQVRKGIKATFDKSVAGGSICSESQFNGTDGVEDCSEVASFNALP